MISTVDFADVYAICFDFPDSKCWAGLRKGACGFAPTLLTAMLFETPEAARKTLENGYGEESRKWGRVVRLTASPL